MAVPVAACLLQLAAHEKSTMTGRAIGEYFDKILYNTEESDLVLCAFSDRELNIATECYLQANGHTL